MHRSTVPLMCGIAGWYRRGERPVSPRVIAAQCDAIFHRGPDDAGILVDRDFGFGMRRLSILDVVGGHQPMTTSGGRYAIVFNGEIYNHRDVRAQLGGSTAGFSTQSDTETVLAAFAAWGDAAWAKLEGMFAVAIWDRRERRLTLARDPLGIKPLYVTEQGGGLAFASELKALRLLPDHRFAVDDRAVDDLFSFGHVRQPRSIFRQVYSLGPGQSLTLGPAGPACAATYWRPRFRIDRGPSDAGWIEQMRALLEETTARHLQADVPVGAFLSGGIDSSAVVAAMRRVSDRPVKAFTVGYPGARIDETQAAAEVARHLGCEHVILPLDEAEAIGRLPEILRCYDEPFADPAAIPTWFASRLAAEQVKVVLCGEGGDELFAGYKRHRNARAIARMRPVIRAIDPLLWALDTLPPLRSAGGNYLRQHARRASEFARLPDGYQQFFAATQISGRTSRQRLYAPDFTRRIAAANDYAELEAEYFAADAPRGISALEEFLFADLTLNMPSAMLTRLDRASMAHSLEARVPLLSHRFVDWALTVPEDLKLRRGTGKHILREAVAPWLPASVFQRPKQGFQIPHTAWLRGALGARAQEAWHESGAADAGYLDRSAVDRMFAEHRRGEADHARLLYAVAAFAFWWQDRRTAALEAAA